MIFSFRSKDLDSAKINAIPIIRSKNLERNVPILPSRLVVIPKKEFKFKASKIVPLSTS